MTTESPVFGLSTFEMVPRARKHEGEKRNGTGKRC